MGLGLSGIHKAMYQKRCKKARLYSYLSVLLWRFHHVTYALDSREEILRGADIFLENGIHIETSPHKRAIQSCVGRVLTRRSMRDGGLKRTRPTSLPNHTTVQFSIHCTPKRSVSLP